MKSLKSPSRSRKQSLLLKLKLRARKRAQRATLTPQEPKKKSFILNDDGIENLEKFRLKKMEEISQAPSSISDFEKEILRGPNNAEMWIFYLGFVYENEGLQKARKLWKRAMSVVTFRDDKARMSLWKARINLEFHFGTEATTSKIFKEAVNACDHFDLCMHLVELYKGKGSWETGEMFVKLNLKKSRKGKKAWSEYIRFLYAWYTSLKDEEDRQMVEKKIQVVLSRALQSLDDSENDKIYFLSRKAVEEFKAGECERGRTTFNQLVARVPKRTDLWMVYLDMEVKYGEDVERARELFERLLALNFKVKSMKTVFMKYLGFEKAKGTPKRAELVKKAARLYIEEQMRLRDGDNEEIMEEGEMVI